MHATWKKCHIQVGIKELARSVSWLNVVKDNQTRLCLILVSFRACFPFTEATSIALGNFVFFPHVNSLLVVLMWLTQAMQMTE